VPYWGPGTKTNFPTDRRWQYNLKLNLRHCTANYRPVLFNCHSDKCNIWSLAPRGTRHQDELADWPSVVMWLRLRTSRESHNVTTTKWKGDSVRTSQESHNVTTTKWKGYSIRTSQESLNVTTTKWKGDSVRTSQESRNVTTTKWKRDSIRTSQKSNNVTTTKWKRESCPRLANFMRKL
jgi:FlaG/FlaF family flagellin (archaellin)